MASDDLIYLDHNATTPVDPAVLEAMLPCFHAVYGNPASRQHDAGRRAEAVVQKAADQVAALMHADSRDLIWTSGATESNNMALAGAARWRRAHEQRDHLVTTTIEHKSVGMVIDRLEAEGFAVTRVDPDHTGVVHAQAVQAAITDRTALVSVQWANHETGAIQPVHDVGQICRDRGAWFHCDATQALGKIPVDVASAAVDLLSASAHKLYGPKGVGVLYVRRRRPRIRLEPLIVGGGQQRDLRAGTLNVPGIVGFGAACELASSCLSAEAERLSDLRDQLQHRLVESVQGARAHAAEAWRLPHVLNITLGPIDAQALMVAVPQVAFSQGSACTASSIEAGYVLRRMGLNEYDVRASARFGLGRSTTAKQIHQAADLLIQALARPESWSGACGA